MVFLILYNVFFLILLKMGFSSYCKMGFSSYCKMTCQSDTFRHQSTLGTQESMHEGRHVHSALPGIKINLLLMKT